MHVYFKLTLYHVYKCNATLLPYIHLICTTYIHYTLTSGISMEGGCYPRGGSNKLAKELVPVIESYGGRVLVRAQVEKILFESKYTCMRIRIRSRMCIWYVLCICAWIGWVYDNLCVYVDEWSLWCLLCKYVYAHVIRVTYSIFLV